MPASDRLTFMSCAASSRANVRQCIPFGLLPLPFKMPASQPSRLRIVSARRAVQDMLRPTHKVLGAINET